MLKVYNTSSKKKEKFIPIDPNNIKIYVCGMTVYDYCHIGHARVLVMFDVIVRHLKRCYKNVTYVRNITDIDDKIINCANKNKEDVFSLTKRFIAEMHKDEKSLAINPPDAEPKATDYVDQMLYLIKSLQDNNLAYKADNGDVYFSVRSFKKYGKLANKTLDELKSGARVDVDSTKLDPLDFVLWKSAKPNEPSWQSPWGKGRPGWHIECSAMSTHLLGNKFDIHGGGADLIFPHHENEIAQSEGAHGGKFVNYWIHVGFVNINNEKMSKSLNNFFTIRDILKSYSGEVLRYFIISSHYRSPLNFNDNNLKSAKSALTKLYIAIKDLSADEASMNEISQQYDYEYKFINALNDDFNTPIAISILFEIAKEINKNRDNDIAKASALARLLIILGGYIGILQMDVNTFLKQGILLADAEIERKIAERNKARKNKDFALSDKIRDELKSKNIVLEDNPTGTSWRRL